MKRVVLTTVVALMVLSGTSLVFSDVFTRVIDNGLESVRISNAAVTSPAAVNESYTVIGWNDLGMHCISPSFKGMAILLTGSRRTEPLPGPMVSRPARYATART